MIRWQLAAAVCGVATSLCGVPLACLAQAEGARASSEASAPQSLEQIAAELRKIGPVIEAARTAQLYAPLQPSEPYQDVQVARDVAYGPHERHVLDVFTGKAAGAQRKPIVVFIHGGGFAAGSKRRAGSPFYDNIGVWAAKNGLVGVTINYRLAPQFPFPAGVEDLARVVGWLQANAAQHGGDAGRIFLWGHSAGGAHAADYIARTAQPGVAGAILTSGIYDIVDGDKVSVWKSYYGEDVTKYREMSSVPGLIKTSVPLFVTYAELDPQNFIVDSERLIKARADAGKPVKHLRLTGHSHISETYAVGTQDDSLSGSVLEFIRGEGLKR